MKKTLFATISILLMLFAFVACDGSNQGPTGGDVTESEAKTLAGNYLGSINFSQLIVDAFNDDVKGVSVESATANGFVITLKDYSGKAFEGTTIKVPASKATAADSATDDTESSEEEGESIKITKVASGSIEFTFTTADSKTTYTARTLEKAPIVFEGAPEGADLAFEISGPASVSFSKLSGGIITGFESESTVKISAPTTSEISVGGASVKYDDIKESAKGGFDQTATTPEVVGEDGETITTPDFTADNAKTIAAKIFAALSRENLKNDLMKGLAEINDNNDSVKNVTLDGFEVLYRGSKNETLTAIFKDLFAEGAGGKSLTEWPEGVNPKDISNITIKLTVSFKDYQNAFKEASGVYSIVSGQVVVSLVPGIADLSKLTIDGTYTVKTEKPVVVSTADGNYSITIDKLASLFNLDGTTTANSDLEVTKETDTSPVISISDYNGKSQTLDWPSLTTAIDAIDKGTGYAEETAEQIDAEYFYQHFGTNKFLNNLHDVLTDDSKEATYGLKVNNRNNLILNDDKEFTLDVTFTNYVYYFTGGSQQVTGNVKFVFENSEAGTKETSDTSSTTFKATSFTVSSGELTLSDNLKNRTGATATFGTTGITGTIGDDNAADKDSHSSETQGIDFTLNGTTITGLTSYKNNYSGYLHEFVLTSEGGITSIEIELDK